MTKAPKGSKPKKSFKRRLLKFFGILAFIATVLLAAVLFYGWQKLKGSQAILDGELVIRGLSQPVSIDRDRLGIPTVIASNQLDLSRAMGFVHAQDRFFQMDGMRRFPAGELAEVFGPTLIGTDVEMKRHQMRATAREVYRQAHPEYRQLLEAYADGVNQGLGAMRTPPLEYLLLKAKPQPWKPEDTALVIFVMTLDLQDKDGQFERALGTMQATLPQGLLTYLTPQGSEWDAPMQGGALPPAEIPGPEVLDLRNEKKSAALDTHKLLGDLKPGSNSWAVSGTLTTHGKGMIANDMHLNLSVPHIWFRARMMWEDAQGESWDLNGVTLPGAPTLVAGSNRHIAWGFTNSYMDWSDIITLEPVPSQPGHYQTPDGPKPIEKVPVSIKVNQAEDHQTSFENTIWGPVIGKDLNGNKLVINWTVHHPEATNFQIFAINKAKTATEALTLAKRCGIPGQNLVVADSAGNVGWTVAGILPNRVGFDGKYPSSWADGTRYWDGWLPTAAYPQVYNPESNRLWTANARVVGETHLAIVGDGGYALGARAKQIRDRLFEKNSFSEQDLLAIQLDDEALFFQRWQQLLLSQLETRNDSTAAALKPFIENWGGYAKTSSVGFRLVRHYRLNIVENILKALATPVLKTDPSFDFDQIPQQEGIVWKLIEAQPEHLVPPGHDSWQAYLQDEIDTLYKQVKTMSADLSQHTWGKRNTLRMTHPFHDKIPYVGHYLNMPADSLDGDGYMPRVQGPGFGASQRMVIAPGQEEKAIFQMPGGQSGHVLSKFYRAGHENWVNGSPSPLLPGASIHQLILRPEGS